VLVASIVGTRSQFIKAAVVGRALRKEHEEFLIHTGQHYDANMSDVFYNELDIPSPDVHLEIGSHSAHHQAHGRGSYSRNWPDYRVEPTSCAALGEGRHCLGYSFISGFCSGIHLQSGAKVVSDSIPIHSRNCDAHTCGHNCSRR
jgi:UDP-N-acetylglucosamine 2-epimerase